MIPFFIQKISHQNYFFLSLTAICFCNKMRKNIFLTITIKYLHVICKSLCNTAFQPVATIGLILSFIALHIFFQFIFVVCRTYIIDENLILKKTYHHLISHARLQLIANAVRNHFKNTFTKSNAHFKAKYSKIYSYVAHPRLLLVINYW